MFRKNTAKLNIKNAPKSLEYNVWYNLVTPFDWQYFKVKKGSKYVYIYDYIKDSKPCLTVTKDVFLDYLKIAKSIPCKTDISEFVDNE